MRLRKISLRDSTLNMAPLIDIVFLLISFFTLVINFSKAEQNERVTLPKSELAQPPESFSGEVLTFQVTPDQEIILGSITCHLDNPGTVALGSPFSLALRDELRVLRAVSRIEPKEVTAVIRGDENVRFGFVQELIAACQNQGIEEFILRARQVREE